MDPIKAPQPATDYFGFRLWAKIFLVIAIFLTAAGVIAALTGSGAAGTNGLILICTGISAGIISVILVLFAILDQAGQ